MKAVHVVEQSKRGHTHIRRSCTQVYTGEWQHAAYMRVVHVEQSE